MQRGRKALQLWRGVTAAQALFLLVWYSGLLPAAWVEQVFSRGWYRIMLLFLPRLSGWSSYSLFIFLIPLALLALAGVSVWIWRRSAPYPPIRRSGAVLSIWLLVSINTVFCFVVVWGGGYQRTPLKVRLALDGVQPAPGELMRIAETALQMVRDHAEPAVGRDRNAAIAAIARRMAELTAGWDGRALVLPVYVKRTPPGVFLVNGTAGMCSPFTLEAQVDGGLPDAAFVGVASHELAHLAGNCPEDEASLVGYLAGLEADHPFARYAVALRLFQDIAGNLPRADRDRLHEALPGVAKDDIRLAREAGRRYRIAAARKVSQRAYNQYLKSQGVESGLKNYGEVTTLFVQAWRKGLAPAIAPMQPAAGGVAAAN